MTATEEETADPTLELDSQIRRPQLKLSQLIDIINRGENKTKLKEILSAPQLKNQLDSVELKKLRIKDVARDAYVNDLADNLTANWRSRIKTNKLVKTDTLIIGDTFEGIFNAPKETKTFDFRILLLIGIAMFVFVSYFWGPAISLYFQTNWGAIDPASRTAGTVLVLLILVIAFIMFWRRRKKA